MPPMILSPSDLQGVLAGYQPVLESRLHAHPLQPNPPVMYKTLDMCYNHNRVACVSRTAVRCREAHIDPSKL